MRHKFQIPYLVFAFALALCGCGKSATSPDNATSSGGNATTEGSSGGQKAAEQAAESAPAPKPIVVEPGTEIMVTADQSVSSKTNNSGDRFDASLAEPVLAGDNVVIPKGAKATGTVVAAKSAGRFKGNAAITVTLASVTIKGKEYPVKTSEITEASKGRGKRTAEGAGGGAVVGALIGALAGKGKGAAIGAAAGAGAGTAGAAMTGDRDITIAAERKLTFKLKEPLEIGRK
jgi:hypothetical protein